MTSGTRQSGTQQSGPGRPRDAGRDAAIMDAVVRLVGEVGFDAMTIDAVASAAGVSKPTIYRRWAGKTELVIDTVRHRRGVPVTVADTGALRSDLVALLTGTVAGLTSDSGLVAGVVTAMRSRPELRTAIDEIAVTEFGGRLATVVQRGRDRGEVAEGVDVEMLVEVVRSTVLARVVYHPRPTGPEFVARLVDHVVVPLLTAAPTTPSRVGIEPTI